tara:strand:+ start:1919 stop:3427 length:1509 start_codon:yes stop_codon:yes gene_type:complete
MSNPETAAQFLGEKWKPIVEHPSLPPIKDSYRKNVTTVLLENQEKALQEQANNIVGGGMSPVVGGEGQIKGFDPILISLVRRAMPNLMAYDICGVQPMTGPTGLIFALRAKYGTQSGTEALFNEPAYKYSGSTSAVGDTTVGQDGTIGACGPSEFDPVGNVAYLNGASGSETGGFFNAVDVQTGLPTSTGEVLGASGNFVFPEMAFSIERTSVEAKTRALKAEYTTELAQDLKAVHGLDAETELANILSTEVLAEINREVIRTIYRIAKLGAQQTDLYYKGGSTLGGLRSPGNHVTYSGVTGATGQGGIYDLDKDSDGRWSAERFRGLQFQLEREANQIAKDTRRGKGNFVIVTADVASALAMSGFLQISGAAGLEGEVDDTGNTFVGTLNGKLKVYIDPYSAGVNYACVGYRGTSPYDAGLFYCPYVPLQMVRAVGENDFQPRIGFKTRYGMTMNPFAGGDNTYADLDPAGITAIRRNQYFRIFRIDGLHGGAVGSSGLTP